MFLLEPYKFVKEILDEKSGLGLRGKIVKEVVRMGLGEKNNREVVKNVLRKLIRLHQAVHKNGCKHVENFLNKIGFYEFANK